MPQIRAIDDVQTPRRDGKWDLLHAAEKCGLSHRTGRTVKERYGKYLSFPISPEDLLVLKTLGEVFLFTPPVQSGKRVSATEIEQRDRVIVEACRRVWADQIPGARLLVTAGYAVLCVDREQVSDMLESTSINPTYTVNLLPVGVWMKELRTSLVQEAL